MRLNIFRIPQDQVSNLKAKLAESKMSVIKEVEQASWGGSFYFSTEAMPTSIPWVMTFRSYFDEPLPMNRSHFAVFIFEKDDECFALSFGKAHFYIRPDCDYDFGIDLAKRIANERDIRQTAGKRFAGKRTKDIKSYTANTPLIVESGESVDYLQASIVTDSQATYGKSGKFGTSAQVSPAIEVSEIGQFLTKVVTELKRDPRFKLPRTTVISDKGEVARFDELLLDELLTPRGPSEFTNNAIDLYGVDFIFPSQRAGTFTLKYGRRKRTLDQLTMGDLKQFIADEGIERENVLKIKISHESEDEPARVESIRESVDYIADGEHVVLSGGKWLHFNQDYLEQLNDAIREIEMEVVEPEFAVINIREPAFNVSDAIVAAGFELADKNFDIFKTASSTQIEAWDLRRSNTVYAVKFGDAQKLHYVCDQALNVLELMRNKAEIKKIPDFDRYCLWFGYRVKTLPPSMADSGSIILKQKIEAWARKANELGVTPVIRLSQQLLPGIDDTEKPESAST